MNTILYLYKTAFKNKIRKALRKPITYIYAVVLIGYLAMMFSAGSTLAKEVRGYGERIFFMVACVLIVVTVSGNLIGYSAKKGLIFTQSDVHFLFQIPMNPKKILFYAQLRTMFGSFLLNLLFVAIGFLCIHVDIWKLLLYIIVFWILENIMETSLMILIYGNESMSGSNMKIFCNILKVIVAIFVLYAFCLAIQDGVNIKIAETIFFNPVIQCIPLLGWIVATLELIFIKATTVNIVCSILYVVLLIVVVVLAKKMHCTGLYFEDAMKFADTYTETRKRAKKGEVVFANEKKKFKRAEITYQGTGAKALFYRQLLEYKKTKWFIFGKSSLFYLVAGIGVVVFFYQNPDMAGNNAWLVIGGVALYLFFLSSGFTTKWQMELTSPYTFLIPDTNLRKLWYSSVIEHIRAISNAIFAMIPGAIYARIPPITVLLMIVAFVCFSASKTYAGIVCEEILGNTLGQNAKIYLRTFLIMAIFGISMLGAVLASAIAGKDAGFLGFIIITILLTFILGLSASMMFDKMERNE